MRLRNICKPDNDKGDGKDSHSKNHNRSNLCNGSVRNLSSNNPAYEIRSEGAADGVEATAPLNELVTLVSATAEGVEHRVYDNVEQTH